MQKKKKKTNMNVISLLFRQNLDQYFQEISRIA